MTNQKKPMGGPLPMDTPITKMLDPKIAEMLTPDASRLTKGDLFGLYSYSRYQPDEDEVARMESEGVHVPKDLTIEDVQSIDRAFTLQHGLHPTGAMDTLPQPLGDSCCCCCSTAPCCCCTAAAETTPTQPAA